MKAALKLLKGKLKGENVCWGVKTWSLHVIITICKGGFLPYIYIWMQCYSQILEVQTCVIMCVKRVGADGSPFFKWHFNYKVVQHHIITLLQTPKATETSHRLHLHYKTPNVSTHKHRHSKTTFVHTWRRCSINILGSSELRAHTHSLAHSRQE